ncbi:MAG: MazG family protein [Acidimicrobiales bacterium]|nr:MazG family protein [Acidimicrobiales bacterium]
MKPKIVVAGLGPADERWLTAAVRTAIDRIPVRFVRTERHPAVSAVPDARSFDAEYDRASSLEEVYQSIASSLVSEARKQGEVLYAVPGSPLVAERSVELLLADSEVEVELLPGLSFIDLAWARLQVDPVAAGVRLVDGHRFDVEAAGQRGPLLVAQCDSVDVLSSVKLAIADALELSETGLGALGSSLQLTVLQRLGADDERVVMVRWDDLDREIEPDHLTSVWMPQLAAPIAGEVQRFAELVATLRRECPWDREQTHDSLRRHLLEETYEVLDALAAVDPDTGAGYDHLREELGDLLFQIVFHCTLAGEVGQFTLADVARGIHDKLYARHPHVFGQVPEGLAPGVNAAEVADNWERIKKIEKGRASIFDGIPDALPALLFALKIQKKAASLGELSEDVPAPASWDPVLTAAKRHPTPQAIGDLLFAVVNQARHAGVDPESALRDAAIRYREQIKAIEH